MKKITKEKIQLINKHIKIFILHSKVMQMSNIKEVSISRL